MVRVEDQNGKEVHSKFHELCPWSSFSSAFCNEEVLDEDELDELKETQNYWNNLKFDDTSALLYKPVLDQLTEADAESDVIEEMFIFNLLKGSVKGMETCDIEVGDCCDYPKFTVQYDIEIPDGEEFDIEKLNFFNVDIEDPGCWEDLNFAITEDKLFLDTIIYDGKVYTGSTGPEKIMPNSCIAHIEVETFTEFDEI